MPSDNLPPAISFCPYIGKTVRTTQVSGFVTDSFDQLSHDNRDIAQVMDFHVGHFYRFELDIA
jgi:hypothetical protein